MSVPKRFRPTKVRSAVVAALGAAAVGTCLPALAQNAQTDPNEEPIEEIVTTGTVLKRADNEALPLSVITAEDMELRGINTISEMALRLPQNNAGTIVNNWNVGFNFATGATAPALRGLTVQSTLSIADGLRLAPYPLADDGQRNFVDLNTIPNAIVERVEVLRDGASSTYGADAIAGVVNVITKKEIQGLHLNASGGFSQQGGGAEQKIDVSWGTGDLGSDGFNFYVAAEYMLMENVNRAERDAPFNSANWQSICGPSGSCMPNYNWNGITEEDGSWNGWVSDIPGVVYVRPIDAAGNAAGQFEFLNPAAGCRGLNEVAVPLANQNGTNPDIACEWDYWNVHQLQPEIERMGLSTRFTKDFDNGTEFYAMANFYRTDTSSYYLPINFDRGTTPPQGLNYAGTYQAYAPAYVCATGVGTLDGLNTGCDATNGQLNPYNPYAAAGQRAEVEFRAPMERTRFTDTTTRVSRVAFGLNGLFAEKWNYNASYTFSEVNLTRTQNGGMIPQKIADVLAQGTFNLMDPMATPNEVWDYIMPTSEVVSPSRLWQIDGNIGREFGELAGGPVQAAIGLSHRAESIDAPSANPANDSSPYERYTGYNSVGTAGSRQVDSAYFEVLAPFTETFEMVASGRYDDYSTGQSNFSPKIGAKFSPLDQLTLRASWSEGFRIPSFNEAFGLPTTGYVTRTIDCTNNVEYVDFCNAHGGSGSAYAEGQYSLGLTQTGDPTLEPEESESFTVGAIWNATDFLTITVDYWNIEVSNLITGVTDTSEAEDQYYLNNGVVTIPGITVLPAPPDASFPNALPLLGFLQSSYQNQDKQEVNGWDFSVTLTGIDLGGRADWSSRFDASFLNEYTLRTDSGDVLEYAGTLSPCNVTSCSGAPEWRLSWANTFDFSDRTTATVTAYMTQGVDNASVDFGGIKGDCDNNIGASVLTYVDGTPTDCKSNDQWNVDLTVQHQLNDNVRLFADFMNVLDIDPELDVSAAYHIYAFNPAWSGPNIMGRYFRLGARLDFE
ncbi:MAG: TonB-dependent receptor [Gammaproteobacteria bacterium]|nr:TonB-dependent receptor [Gammaproteobacteria bacterium]MBT8110058.1 TonB-dependent receptor [Gammaproteobacteria bacterium]NND47881.1 TonB-dependent receptor [Woeseiaceae bacterium]NNL44762.1 TonB-dependent receptor [Woeseiaceae bacterium]